jgi:hypothetical protein
MLRSNTATRRFSINARVRLYAQDQKSNSKEYQGRELRRVYKCPQVSFDLRRSGSEMPEDVKTGLIPISKASPGFQAHLVETLTNHDGSTQQPAHRLA